MRLTARLIPALILGLTLSVTACGGGAAGPPVAAATGTRAASASGGSAGGGKAKLTQNELAYAQCMRGHGVPDFPDPGPNGFSQAGIDKQSPAVQAAEKTCRPLMTAGLSPVVPSATQLLAFAQCIRQHGYPDFPDPTVSGGVIHVDWKSVGASATSPQVQAVMRQCSKYLKRNSGSGS
jgi:hypothetical protein